MGRGYENFNSSGFQGFYEFMQRLDYFEIRIKINVEIFDFRVLSSIFLRKYWEIFSSVLGTKRVKKYFLDFLNKDCQNHFWLALCLCRSKITFAKDHWLILSISKSCYRTGNRGMHQIKEKNIHLEMGINLSRSKKWCTIRIEYVHSSINFSNSIQIKEARVQRHTECSHDCSKDDNAYWLHPQFPNRIFVDIYVFHWQVCEPENATSQQI